MTKREKADWLQKHVPHRIRAAIARTPLLKQLLTDCPEFHGARGGDAEKTAERCQNDAVHEGRLAATRWLIEFVGVRSNHRNDVRIDALGGDLFDHSSADAKTLEEVWLGCTKASSHATNAGHPKVDETELNDALEIVLKHINAQFGSTLGKKIEDIALVPPDDSSS